MRRARLLTTTALCLSLILSCTKAEPVQGVLPTEDPNLQTLVLRQSDALLNMDPAIMTSGSDYMVAYIVYSGLVRLKPGSSEIEGDLATSWKVSSDGLTYTFALRQGVQWHKGYGGFTADDVVYSFNRVKDPATGSRYTADFAPVTKVEALDKHTVQISLKEGYPAFFEAVLAYRPGFIVNKKAIETLGKGYVNSPIGTGPYVFDKWVPGDRIELSANPDYYGPKPKIKTVVYRLITDDQVAEIALSKGEIDVAYFDAAEVQKRVAADSSLQVTQRPMPRTYFITLNLKRKPLDNVLVRQAIDMAIDKKAIVDFIFLGMGRVAYSPVNPNVFGFLDKKGNDYNVTRAKELLAQAGYPNGIEQTLDFVTGTGSSMPQLTEAIQAQLAKVGIKTKVTTLERALFEERRNKNNYDLLTLTSLRVDASQILVPYFNSAQAPFPNINGYSGADAIINQAVREPDSKKREQMYFQAQEQIMKDLPAISVLYPVQVLAMRKGIDGAAIGLLTYPVWQMSFSRKK